MGPERLGELIDNHAAALILYARQWCASPEDVVQEAFVKLARQREEPRCPLAWLHTTVRNGAISAARSEQRRRRHEEHAARNFEPWFESDELTRTDEEIVVASLASLPLEEREVIVAHIWGELTFAQIGTMLGNSAATAHRRYVAGLEKLRDKMGVTCPTHPIH